jgi:CDP-4-dehydro-6-deoxyglucose reductase/ferredoxin-NAD(P)+ reductase (naphthalene dioxygenase ferredoxin-specific)
MKVHIINLGQSIEVPEFETILNAALMAGLEYPCGCMEGHCGACKTHLQSGRIDTCKSRGLALTEGEIAQGWFLACQARPLSDLVISYKG